MKISKLALVFFFTIPLSSLAQKTATLIYIDQYKDIAVSEMKRTGIPASITLAQGIIESNSGESNLALNYKNHFGIKCKSDWKGETTYQDDDAKQECFRVYPNSNASFIDHSNFLKSRPNYAPLFELDPVDDSAWAYGLKKAGYATASDYPKKLLKVINDFELSQYNFPELAIFDDEDTPSQKIDTTKKIEAVKMDTIRLSRVKGIDNSENIKNTAPTAMKGIGAIATELPKKHTQKTDTINKIIDNKFKDTSVVERKISDTSNIDVKIENNPIQFVYPKGKFKVNQLLAIYAKAGSSFLEIANTYNIALYKLYTFNDLAETDLVAKDQILYLVSKRKEIIKKLHLVKAGESLYDISQMEGIQLSYLQLYNPTITDINLKAGTTLALFKINEAAKQIASPIKEINIPNFLKRKKNN
jgi:hypothetical protein